LPGKQARELARFQCPAEQEYPHRLSPNFRSRSHDFAILRKMAVADWHRRRWCRGSFSCRADTARASPIGCGRRPPPRACGSARGQTMTWPSPMAAAIPEILALRGSPVCVLASGDPFFYGAGSLLSAHVRPEEMQCLPAPSAFSLAAARLNWSLQECCLVSLHGREFERIIRHCSARENPMSIVGRDDAATPCKAPLRERPRPIADHCDGGDGRPERAPA